VTLVMLGTPVAACRRVPAPTASGASTPSAPAVSARSAPAASVDSTDSTASEPLPFLADGCPAGQHDVRRWRRIDPTTVTVDQRYSLNYSPCSWDVSVRDGVAVAQAHHDAQPMVPPGLRFPEHWGAPRIVRRGRSGSLVGFDHGEWGGGLLWYSDGGSFRGELLGENVVELLAVTGGFIVLTGLSHLGSDVGHVTELVDTGTIFRIERSADLGSAPRAVVLEGDGAVLVVTMAGLVRISPSFQVTRLLSSRWGMFYPVSLVLDGAIAYVGVRGIVVEVQLGADTATETWLSLVDFK
jgi:hypothetical protein